MASLLRLTRSSAVQRSQNISSCTTALTAFYRALHCSAPTYVGVAGASGASSVRAALLRRSLARANQGNDAAAAAAATAAAAAVPAAADGSKAKPLNPIRSRAPAPEPPPPTPEELAAAAEERRIEESAKRKAMHVKKRRPPSEETWTEAVITAKVHEVLAKGRAAYKAYLDAGGSPEVYAKAVTDAAAAAVATPADMPQPAAVSASPASLADFTFPQLNSYERWLVHTIATREGGEEISHVTDSLFQQRWIVLRYQPPGSTPPPKLVPAVVELPPAEQLADVVASLPPVPTREEKREEQAAAFTE